MQRIQQYCLPGKTKAVIAVNITCLGEEEEEMVCQCGDGD